jgi:hypothetical protein
MTSEEFRATLAGAEPPPGVSPILRALWLDGKGDWSGAHRLVDDLETIDAMRVHAYLHRKEGDTSNARYWYTRAGIEPSLLPLEREWERLVRDLLIAA